MTNAPTTDQAEFRPPATASSNYNAHTTAQVGVGSSRGFVANTIDAEFRAPATASSNYNAHPQQPLSGTVAATISGLGRRPFDDPVSTANAPRSWQDTLSRTQSQQVATTAATVQERAGPPDAYVSLGPCNRVCHHCKALFRFEKRLMLQVFIS